jgi:hopanoid biosynthesis associated radical SAM protein HpnH
MRRPAKLDLAMARYLMVQKARRKKHFPFVTMLEPLEACNLHCIGCGRVIEYKDAIHERLSVEESLVAVHASGGPIVSVSGGEPLLHEQIGEIVRAITEEKRFVYLCTNGLLLREKLDLFKPSPYLSFVVHVDGTKKIHDYVTRREGTYDEAIAGIREAIARGFRVNTNSTLFHGSDVEDLHTLFAQLTEMGVEGLMVSPGYAYEDVSDRELFLKRTTTRSTSISCVGRGNMIARLGRRRPTRCADGGNPATSWPMSTQTISKSSSSPSCGNDTDPGGTGAASTA